LEDYNQTESNTMSTQALAERVASHPFWWHSIDLGAGVVTPGHKPLSVLQDELDYVKLPDLRGKTVLDIGAWDGYFSFAAERQGASRVVALDYWTWATNPAAIVDRASSTATPAWDTVGLPGKGGFELAREALGSGVESVFKDLHVLDPSELGQFDVVLLLGVLYHTRYPVEMLEKVAALTRETMVIETESFTIPGFEGASLGQFFETDELAGDDSNWWSLTQPAIAGMCRASGFSEVSFLEPYHRFAPEANGLVRHRAIGHATK
jgi:tRNA (mo5U34)-methyltransferase